MSVEDFNSTLGVLGYITYQCDIQFQLPIQSSDYHIESNPPNGKSRSEAHRHSFKTLSQKVPLGAHSTELKNTEP